MTGCVRLQKAPGVSGCGAVYCAHNWGGPEREFPRVPASLPVTTKPPKGCRDFPESLGAGQALHARPFPPAWQGHPRTLQRPGDRGRRLCAVSRRCLLPHLPLAWGSGRQSRDTCLPTEAWRPLPALPQLGNHLWGRHPPTRGCSWGPQEGSQGYRATPRGPRRREPPASPPLCHPCSGPHQQQTPGSWSMRRKTGKYSDQREGITVQKKPVQPERAPARLERPTPLRPRRPHPCPLGGKATKAGAGPDWGARAGV